jgi:hypothetical protein
MPSTSTSQAQAVESGSYRGLLMWASVNRDAIVEPWCPAGRDPQRWRVTARASPGSHDSSRVPVANRRRRRSR